ncbi:MAG: beta-lactamase [Rhodospirillaceae bacterium BRH_c57]|nr:MAG: beta-lactamase [Rhodospirillaceae bacterium BRH_c57]
MRALLSLVFLVWTATAAHAADLSYALTPRLIAPGTYIVEGRREHFSRDNGGNIVNTAFIVTAAGVVIIDTGPSALYGRELRAAIGQVTPLPVVKVVNTHHHPDHFLGNQAFADIGVAASATTAGIIARDGQSLTENLYRLNGDWMRGTEPQAPTGRLEGGVEEIGGHRLRWLLLAGHTAADVALFDQTTGVLFTADLVFKDRAPTTPDADIAAWLAALDVLEALPFRILVPGHGNEATDAAPIAQTRAWLGWLDSTLGAAAAQGLSRTEAMQLPIPADFSALALARDEFQRSVVHLYPTLEAGALQRVVGPK